MRQHGPTETSGAPRQAKAENVTGRRRGPGQTGLFIISIFVLSLLAPIGALAAPYAGMVMDARSGKVYYSENADTRLHPASLTKMMTLYIAFEAVQNGELSMDTMVTISRAAASEPPSKLGLRAGQQIKLRYLVRAAAVKSANDAATALGEARSGIHALGAPVRTAGSWCGQLCRAVEQHHRIEDAVLYPALRAADDGLAAVLAEPHTAVVTARRQQHAPAVLMCRWILEVIPGKSR